MTRVADSIGEQKVADGVLWERTFLGWVQVPGGQMSGWQRADPLVFTGKDVGGNDQFTDAFTTRWFREITRGVDPAADMFPDEPSLWAVVDSTFYGAREEGSTAQVEACFEAVICRDPDLPGDTELLSVAEYQNIAGDDRKNADCSDERLTQYASDDDPPSDSWWNELMDEQDSGDYSRYHLAVTG